MLWELGVDPLQRRETLARAHDARRLRSRFAGTGWRRVVDDAAQLVFNLDEEFAAFLQGCICR